MVTLDWQGKEDTLRNTRMLMGAKYTGHVRWNADSSIFIEGENIDALFTLVQTHKEKVKLIYIDPPYNTGGIGYGYKNKFSIDEWLCMMYPRLVLARELLRDDGAIFISISDDMQGVLRMLAEEVFGTKNFISNIIWQKNKTQQNCCKHLARTHDFILVFAKNAKTWRPNLLPRTEKQLAAYKHVDDVNGEPCAYAWKDMTMQINAADRGKVYSLESVSRPKTQDRTNPYALEAMNSQALGAEADPYKLVDFTAQYGSINTYYPITAPSGKVHYPPKGRHWRYTKQNFDALLADNKIYFGKDGNGMPSVKRHLSDVRPGVVPNTIWLADFAGTTTQARRQMKKLVEGTDYLLFDTSKPVELMLQILKIATDKDSIVLDFFAGSGTLAVATEQLNSEDQGNRKWMLCENNAKIAALARLRLKDSVFQDFVCAESVL